MLRARSFIPFLDRVGFGHVFAFLCGSVETRAFPMVNVRLSINPDQTVPSTRRWRIGRWRIRGGTSRRSWTARRRTACRRTLWFK